MLENDLLIYSTNYNREFRVDFDFYYQESRNYTNWEMPEDDIYDKIYFLNQFRCRLPYAIENQLIKNIETVAPLFAQVREVEIQDLHNNEDAYQVISDIYNFLYGNVHRFKATATGKFIHMTLPYLLTMIDSLIGSYMRRQNIIIDKKFKTSDDYIRLLRYYNSEVNELINDIMGNHNLDRIQAINRIKEKDPSALGSIPRIIDKHFYSLAQ